MNTFIKSLLIGALAAAEFSQAVTLERRGTRDGDRQRDDQDGDRQRDDRVISLPSLCTNPDTVTMSGFSAGGSFAHIMHMAHSSKVKGVGIMNGGAYTSDVLDYTEAAVTAADLTADAIAALDQAVIDGTIDDLVASLDPGYAYIVGGTLDEIVPLKNQEAIDDTYDTYRVTTELDVVEDGIHRIQKGKPEEMIRWLYTNMGVATEFADAVDKACEHGTQSKFDQVEVASELGIDEETFQANGILERGYIFVPDSCVEEGAEPCHVHFAFHGESGRDIHKKYISFAAANNIIIVHPKSSREAAWDYQGLIDEDNYANQNGVYPRMIMEMLATLEECPEEEVIEE